MASEEEDTELKDLLKECKLANLYEKFKKMGVTAEILWDVEEEDLQENEFTKFERLRFSKARVTYEKQNSMRPGKIV